MTSKERSILKSHAQRVKSNFQIGAAELHESNLEAISNALNNREILKIKVNRADKSDKQITRNLANEIEKKIDAQVVDVIGTTIILYRKHKDEDKRTIEWLRKY